MEAFFGLREEGFADGLVGGEDGLAFARPVELVSFGWAFDDVLREFLAQQVKVDGRLDLAVLAFGLGQAVGKQPAKLVNGRGCVFAHGTGFWIAGFRFSGQISGGGEAKQGDSCVGFCEGEG